METISHLCKTRCPNDDDVSRGRPEPKVEEGGGATCKNPPKCCIGEVESRRELGGRRRIRQRESCDT